MNISKKLMKIALNLLILIFFLISIFLIFPKIISFFMPFLIGWFIAALASPMVNFLDKNIKIKPKHGSMIIIIGVLSLIFLLGYFSISKLYSQGANIISSLPDFYDNLNRDFELLNAKLSSSDNFLLRGVKDFFIEFNSKLNSITKDLVSSLAPSTAIAAGNFAKNIPSTIVNIIISILSSYFFILERDHIYKFLSDNLNPSIKRPLNSIISNFQYLIGGYFKAQFKIMAIVYFILFIGFLILKIKYSFFLAFFIAFLDFLPFFGTGAVLLPWAFFKLLSSDIHMALGLLAIYLISQLIRQLIQPKILGDTVGLNPLLALIFMYIGYQFFSVWGLIFSVPVGMIIINLYKEGFFDYYLNIFRLILDDLNEFRKL